MKYGLTEITVEKICAVFARFSEIEKAILYGSRAKGNFKTGSDIDLTLYGKALTPNLCSTIASTLDDLLLPYTIDLSVFDELNHAKLQEHIERVGVLFYERVNHVAAMKKGWKTEALGSLCDILDSQRKPITKRDRSPGAYPYYGATGILDFVEGYLFDEPLVLVGEDGAKWGSGENTAFAVQGKFWVNNHAHVLRPHRSALTGNWLTYFLVYSDLSQFVSGLTVPKLNQGNLREIPIPLPSIPEQQRIVGILDEAFDGIATAKANAEKNLQNTRALFESHLQSVFTQRDKGWVEKKLGEVSDVTNGGTPKTGVPEYWGGSHLWITPAEMGKRREPYVSDTERKISDLGLRNSSARMLPPNSVILSSRAPIGHLAINTEPMATNRGCKGLIPGGELEYKFLYYYLSSIVDLLNSLGTGATFRELSGGKLKEVGIPVAPLAEQQRIIEELDTLREETQRLVSLYQRKLTALEALKKSLLHQAFTGAL